MNIYTLNVDQGQFVVVVGDTEAVIIDTYVPLEPKNPIINIKGALAKILPGKNFIGLIVTGFDADHFNQIGLQIVLNKYRPNWIMYPKYFKKTGNADTCFSIITEHEKQTKFDKKSVLLSDNKSRLYSNISNDFIFEIFSPHSSDMNSSNNCSLVCKIKERTTGATYLVTGDTENDRWDSIVKTFGTSLKSDVLDAPHHGSKNGISEDAMGLIKPDTVLISAGLDNQYGHPDNEAIKIFKKYATNVYQTNVKEGQSIKTEIRKDIVKSIKFSI
jgi:beta-lactamase superfamily II metal-dependent hydrolase